MCIRDRTRAAVDKADRDTTLAKEGIISAARKDESVARAEAVSYTHLRAHETVLDLVCRLLLDKKKYNIPNDETIDRQ